ncbi:MAG: universal stress protein [Acidimicrobiia bacterium]|jgi:nucleotide-binding universal stress UspA family protein|nr:universal stress protein [Acidimicrobiia bacterium]
MAVNTILVAVDGSPPASRALEWANDLAAQLDGTLVALHVFEPLMSMGNGDGPVDLASLYDAAQQRLEGEWTAPLRERGTTYRTIITEGRPVDAIADTAESVGADLIALGARSMSVVRQTLLGSTALRLPQETTRPVVVIH